MKYNVKPVVLALSTICIAACTSIGNSDTTGSEPVQTSAITTTTPTSKGAFIEKNGVVVVEFESTDYSGNWRLKSDPKAYGGKAIEWLGEDSFFEPDIDTININVKITTPGSYRFDWITKIGEGTKTTEANDSWLKIESDSFYGYNGSTTVCPKGQDLEKNSCAGELPEGTGKLGWFKAFRMGGEANQYIWSTGTSDRDAHDIFAQFNTPGIYTIKISGRSKHHIIDRFIMVNDPALYEVAKDYDESSRIN